MQNEKRKRRPGFTLTELLVVMGIITLVAILAVPAFRAMTGTQSTEAAHNQLAGLLGRVRGEAISLQQVRGVAFFIDGDTQRVQANIVKQAQYPTATAANPPDLFLDFAEDRDPVLLPVGVGLQMIDDCSVNTNGTNNIITDDVRGDDAYLGFNVGTANATSFRYGGVILFDGYGRVVSKRYGFKCYLETTTGAKTLSNFGKALNMADPPAVDFVPRYFVASPPGPPLSSQFGFVLYEEESFKNLGYTAGDPQIDSAVGVYTDAPEASAASRSLEAQEERWLDANSRPELVNRNNGTLVRGE